MAKELSEEIERCPACNEKLYCYVIRYPGSLGMCMWCLQILKTTEDLQPVVIEQWELDAHFGHLKFFIEIQTRNPERKDPNKPNLQGLDYMPIPITDMMRNVDSLE